jgi:transcriptional regulator GlxA family with amidase domain
MPRSPTIAIVVYQGVLVDETEVIRFVLGHIPDLQTVTVSTTRGTFAGPGGEQTAEATLEEIGNPEIIAIPGGIGSDHRTDIADWLRTVSPSWIISTSTGSALLAAAGLLGHDTAATHWLAGPLLERYGAHPSREQLVVNNRIVTCAGSSSAFRGALVIAEAYGGQELVEKIRAKVWRAGQAPSPEQHRAFWMRLRNSLWRSRDEQELSKVPVTDEPALSGVNVLDLGMITLHPRDDDHTERY